MVDYEPTILYARFDLATGVLSLTTEDGYGAQVYADRYLAQMLGEALVQYARERGDDE
jgi:hypothetical protein